MDRFYSLTSRLFGYLAFALALLAPLAVPRSGFADSGSDCMTACQTTCTAQCAGEPSCLSNCNAMCPGACCYTQCNGETICQSSCCASLCNNDRTCEANCGGATSGYPFPILFCSNCDPKYRDKLGKCTQLLCGCTGPGNRCKVSTPYCSCQ